ncbi:hypothetical protein [Aestuariirhabdus litorea]|uniref:hypothetical protein n=1 Tax=Aestuariirhabdus litorea TaxID=2528527 RepID=UPI0013E2F5DA|nr:hypothetical protein [Aestuariirhabdus litorea]
MKRVPMVGHSPGGLKVMAWLMRQQAHFGAVYASPIRRVYLPAVVGERPQSSYLWRS